MFKKLKIIFLSAFVSIILGGFLYQFTETKIDEIKYPAPGEMVDVGGFNLHLQCMGEGLPSVILDAGLGYDSLDWSLVQPEIARFAQVCSYDRAGYGWSEKSHAPRTSKNIVEELHLLLINAHILPPYILVGHSFGGINARLYAATYPDEVAGIILVDACHEDQIKVLSPDLPENIIDEWSENSLLRPMMTHLGVFRLLYHFPFFQQQFQNLPEKVQAIYLAQLSSSKYIETVHKENIAFEESLNQVKRANTNLGATPLIVITAAQPVTKEECGCSQKMLDDITNKWNSLQKDILTHSKNGKQYFAEKSSHMITHEQPEIIVKAVYEMVQSLNLNKAPAVQSKFSSIK